MTGTERTDLRIANTIREQLLLLRHRTKTTWPDGTGRTVDRVQELLATHRKVELATARRLPNAAQRLKVKWDDALKDLTCAIRELAHRKDQVPPDVRPLRDLRQDLDQLRQEFDAVDYFSDVPLLAVTTPRITVRGLDLGRFRIDLNALSLGRRTHKNFFEIHTLDLKCAATNGGVSHPHVLYGHLNAREFTEPIREAKMAGRIADFFNLIVQALKSYDPMTAYVKIEDWHKAFCSQCHQELPEDLRVFCEACDEWCCERCRMKCPECGKHVCQNCQSICPQCGKVLCRSCITTSATCGTSICEDCLQTGLCPACVKEWSQSTGSN